VSQSEAAGHSMERLRGGKGLRPVGGNGFYRPYETIGVDDEQPFRNRITEKLPTIRPRPHLSLPTTTAIIDRNV
jgi:hypothetical protein